MREAWSKDELERAYTTARSESRVAFGNDAVYMERLVQKPRHVEVQVLADKFGNAIHLCERDCSVQRRHQKLIEEAPSPALTPELRQRMGEAAVRAVKEVGYTNAGTIEFLLDADGSFYFMEMNTRIQVEHGVTEAVTGIDLIKQQIRIAFHEPLKIKQKDVKLNGHAMECRINAEDPAKGFMANTGKITFLNVPGGPGVRVDTLLYNGYETSPFYDSMMAKIIVHAPTRLEAIRRMRRALLELVTEGITTNGDFDYLLLHHPDFVKGNYNVSFIENHADEILSWDKAVSDIDE